VGTFAGSRNTTGSLNTFVGLSAGFNNVIGRGNVIVGSFASTKNTNLSALSGIVALGTNSSPTSSNQLVLGSSQFPLTVIPGTTFSSSLSGLRIRLNDSEFTIPLLA
jgi:hypothetical protein